MSSQTPDPYKILGVSKDAQIPEIRSAHRKLVLKCHPDKVQDPELKAQKQDEFQKVQQAYELLSNEKERQKYDDNVKLAELRKQMQNKANISSPRSSPKYAEYEIRTAEPRPSSFKSTSSMPSAGKVYTTYSRSWEDDTGHGPRIVEAEIRTSTSRREASYADKPSKRESERSHRERDRDLRDREKERERDARRRREREEDDARREAERKEARRAEKKRAEKLAAKLKSRATEEKSRHKSPYIEEDEFTIPKPEKKKSSSKKHEEKRERSSHRAEETPVIPSLDREAHNLFNAASYIQRSGGAPSLQRAATTAAYSFRNMAPPAPTPPPAQGAQSAFPAPDDEDIHRSSARALRRGSSDTVKSATARTHKKSREFSEDPVIVDAAPSNVRSSPSTRPTAQFQKATTTPMRAASPPRHNVSRTNTMPAEQSYSRPAAGMTRASTFSYGESQAAPRGRSRSRLQPQIEEESDSDSEYERRQRRERKHRGKKTRSPDEMPRAEMPRRENISRYHVSDGQSKLQNSYARPLEEDYYYSPSHDRPAMARDGSYVSSPGASFPKVRQSKAYSQHDVQYSNHGGYNQPMYREEYPAAAYA